MIALTAIVANPVQCGEDSRIASRPMTQLYLASQSPRRRELLSQIGVQYRVLGVAVEERMESGETPQDYVCRLALEKSQAGWLSLSAQGLEAAPVLGADTIVELDGLVLEKPANEDHAVRMLLSLSGRIHRVFTAVALTYEQHQQVALVETEVGFSEISDAQARRYWATGEPKDKAGGYGIQGAGAVFVNHLSGSYSGVVGLPLFETQNLLKQFDVGVWQFESIAET